jgi:hypothetical protein
MSDDLISTQQTGKTELCIVTTTTSPWANENQA